MRPSRTQIALSSALLAALLLATSAGPASAHKRSMPSGAPVLEALTYTATTSHGADGFLEAEGVAGAGVVKKL